jgi:hypothetical protein
VYNLELAPICIVCGFVREIVCVYAFFSYRTGNRVPIRFAANRTPIRSGNRIRVDCRRPLSHKRSVNKSFRVACRVLFCVFAQKTDGMVGAVDRVDKCTF